MHSHAHISLPLISPTVLMLSSNRSQELTDGLTSPESAVSTTSIVDKMLRAYERSLEQQRIGFCLAIGIWILVVLMGLIGLLWRSGGEEKWEKWRGRPFAGRGGKKEQLETEEKAYFKPLHLRGASTVSLAGRQSPPPKSPVDLQTVHHLANYSFPPSPPPQGPLPPVPNAVDYEMLHTNSLQPSAASWASLVDFFRPTTPHPEPAEPSPPLPPVVEATARRRLELPTITLALPKAFRSNSTSPSKFKPRPFNISRPRPSSKHRRDSDMVDLRTGKYVSRTIPLGSRAGFGGFGEKVRGVGDDLLASTSSREGKDSSVKRRSEGFVEGWYPLPSPPLQRTPSPVEEGSARFSFLPYVPAPSSHLPRVVPPTNPFSDPSTLPTRSTSVQPPISPPPARTLLRGHQLALDPFSDSQSRPLGSTDRPINPFAAPFDGVNEF